MDTSQLTSSYTSSTPWHRPWLRLRHVHTWGALAARYSASRSASINDKDGLGIRPAGSGSNIKGSGGRLGSLLAPKAVKSCAKKWSPETGNQTCSIYNIYVACCTAVLHASLMWSKATCVLRPISAKGLIFSGAEAHGCEEADSVATWKSTCMGACICKPNRKAWARPDKINCSAVNSWDSNLTKCKRSLGSYTLVEAKPSLHCFPPPQ